MENQESATETILIIEDDVTISDLLAYNLRRAGYKVRQERSGRAGLATALAGGTDLVLMDLMLPGLDGLAASRELKRQRPEIPVVMLTARAERETTLAGFDAGADDYVTKPFDMDVLLARIRARLRSPRQAPLGDPARAFGEVILDPDARALRRDTTTIPLKPKEHELLNLLASRPGHLFPREEIVQRVWQHRHLPGSRTLDVHVRRLREKLSSLDAPVAIQTVRGVGYRLTLGRETAERQRTGP